MSRTFALAAIGGPILWGLVWLAFFASITYAECRPYPGHPDYAPTAIVGCEIYGEGTASHWQGPGVAKNDCEWPWTDCKLVRITSLETGRSIVVAPTMFCDCYTGTRDERIVDLDPGAVAALGLRWEDGLYPVRVELVGADDGGPPALLPDTSTGGHP